MSVAVPKHKRSKAQFKEKMGKNRSETLIDQLHKLIFITWGSTDYTLSY